MKTISKITIILLLTLVFISLNSNLKAQTYNAGLRGGLFNGIVLEKHTDELNLYGLLLSTRGNDTKLYLHKNKYIPCTEFNVENLYWYYGFGVQAGIDRVYTPMTDINNFIYYKYTNNISIGIHGDFGLEYHFTSIPLKIGIDYIPQFNVFGKSIVNFIVHDIALTFKYTFGS